MGLLCWVVAFESSIADATHLHTCSAFVSQVRDQQELGEDVEMGVALLC